MPLPATPRHPILPAMDLAKISNATTDASLVHDAKKRALATPVAHVLTPCPKASPPQAQARAIHPNSRDRCKRLRWLTASAYNIKPSRS